MKRCTTCLGVPVGRDVWPTGYESPESEALSVRCCQVREGSCVRQRRFHCTVQ
jgi:hypothetical protein